MFLFTVVCLLIGHVEGTNHTRTVYPVIVQERSHDGFLVLRIHSGLTLSLTKASVASDVLRIRRYLNGTAIDEIVRGSEIERTLYEDKQKMATVSVVIAPNDLRVMGMLSLFESIQPDLYEARDASGRRPHVIKKIRRPTGSKKVILESRKDGPPTKCQGTGLPNNVTVEVYVVSDHHHNKRFSKSDFWIYICIFMNSINAIFKSMACPDVRLVLVGIEKSDKAQESAYILGIDLLNDVTSLYLFREYAYANTARRDLYESVPGHRPKRDISGIAFEGGICTTNFVAIAEDTPGAYSGIIDAAHELAHSMGASHDGSPPNQYINGHPGSLKCSASKGHIMSYVDGGSLRYKLSECNKQEIRHVLRLRGEECWKVKATKTYNVRNIYPGVLLSPRDYCRMLYKNRNMYSLTDAYRSSYCKMRCCYAPEGENRHLCALHRMLDFMSCSYRKKCFQGVCTSERKLLMYSHKKGSWRYQQNLPPQN